MNLKNIALVLEGGGMRGMFSAGVFEAFMVKNLIFPYITAISAGACNVLTYMAQQPMRTRKIIEHFVGDKRYFSLGNWRKTGSIFGFDFIFKDLPEKYLPFDYDAYFSYPGELQVGTTDIVNGRTVWFDRESIGRDFTAVRASASMPFFAPVVEFKGYQLLDGGLVAPIPIAKAESAGYEKFVVVLTRNKGYRKKNSIPKLLVRTKYNTQYPLMTKIMRERPMRYNDQLDYVEELERQGKAVIIRPQIPLEIDKLDAKPNKLIALHDHGIACGLVAYERIMELLRA